MCVQILGQPGTFRDEMLVEEAPYFLAAAEACARMWERHTKAAEPAALIDTGI